LDAAFALTAFHIEATFVSPFQAAYLHLYAIGRKISAFANATCAFPAIHENLPHDGLLSVGRYPR
jgi:hypothetical protein